jgi:hypothetical protein
VSKDSAKFAARRESTIDRLVRAGLPRAMAQGWIEAWDESTAELSDFRKAEAAAAAATRARAAAKEARAIARNSQDGPLTGAEREQTGTREVESHARDAYHDAEADVRVRYQDERHPDSN